MYRVDYDLRDCIEIVEDKPIEVKGEERVIELQLNTINLKTDAVFVLKDSISPGQLVPGLEMEEGHIKVDRNMKTNLPGCFAAGDCIGKPYQYIKAAGEGLVAALNAVSHIDSKR
jgi:thioredoxin reductase (NADPH)